MLLFLDIDGVMVPAKSWQRPEILEDGFPAFALKAVHALQNLITEDTTVILTTSHKSRYTIEQWNEIFVRRGLKISKLKSLDDTISGKSRKDEVLNWFSVNKVNEEFIIIDDDKSLNNLPTYIKDKLILTSSLIGLTNSHLDEIKVLLGQKPELA